MLMKGCPLPNRTFTPTAKLNPSGLHASAELWILKERISFIVTESQILTFSSLPADAKRVPSGLQATTRWGPVWLLKVRSSSPVVASQNLGGPHSKHATRRVPAGHQEIDTANSPSSCTRLGLGFEMKVGFPVAMSHTTTCPRMWREARRVPSGLQATDITWCDSKNFGLRNSSKRVRSPVTGSQIITIPSIWPEARREPSRLQAIDCANVTLPSCGSPGRRSFPMVFPVTASQILIVPSWLVEARRLPSRFHPTANTLLVCPSRVRVSVPVAGSQILSVPSSLAEAR